MKNIDRQHGISLVEILVSLVISIFLLAGIVQVYTGNRATFSFTNALAEIQENGRFALDMISQDLRLAGNWGCIGFDPDDTDNINDTLDAATVPGYDSDFHDFIGEDAITGENNTIVTTFSNSDPLTIRGGKPIVGTIMAPFHGVGTNTLDVRGSTNFGGNDIILVARCGANDLLIDEEADILRVTSSTVNTPTTTTLTVAGTKSQQFEGDAVVIELQTVNYFLGDGAGGEPALFRQEFNQAAQELVEGIEDMQILYGVDLDDDQFPNQYLTANNVPDFDDVVAIRLQLLVRSIDDFVTEDAQVYTFDGVQTTPNDRRIRQVFTTTIALRNRIGDS